MHPVIRIDMLCRDEMVRCSWRTSSRSHIYLWETKGGEQTSIMAALSGLVSGDTDNSSQRTTSCCSFSAFTKRRAEVFSALVSTDKIQYFILTFRATWRAAHISLYQVFIKGCFQSPHSYFYWGRYWYQYLEVLIYKWHFSRYISAHRNVSDWLTQWWSYTSFPVGCFWMNRCEQ